MKALGAVYGKNISLPYVYYTIGKQSGVRVCASDMGIVGTD